MSQICCAGSYILEPSLSFTRINKIVHIINSLGKLSTEMKPVYLISKLLNQFQIKTQIRISMVQHHALDIKYINIRENMFIRIYLSRLCD